MRPSYVDDLCNGDGYEAAHEFRQNCHLGAFFATHLALIELPSIIRENRMDAYRTRSVKIRIFIESIKCISVFTNFNFNTENHIIEMLFDFIMRGNISSDLRIVFCCFQRIESWEGSRLAFGDGKP